MCLTPAECLRNKKVIILGGSYPDLFASLFGCHWFWITWASLVVQMVKNLPAKRETWVRSLGGKDLLEEGMAAPSSILAWRIYGQGGLAGYSPWGCKVAHDLATEYSTLLGLPRWHSGKESSCQCRRHKRLRFNPWVGRFPWSRK